MNSNPSRCDKFRKSITYEISKPNTSSFGNSIFNAFKDLFSKQPPTQKITKSINKSNQNKNIEKIEGKPKIIKITKLENFETKEINKILSNATNTIENTDIDEKLDIKKPYNLKNQGVNHIPIRNGFSLHSQRKFQKSDEIEQKNFSKTINEKNLLKNHDQNEFNINTFNSNEKIENFNILNKTSNNNNKNNLTSTNENNNNLIKTFIDNINIGFDYLFGNRENSFIKQNKNYNRNRFSCKNRANSVSNVNISEHSHNKNKNKVRSNYMNEKYFHDEQPNNKEKNINNIINCGLKTMLVKKQINLTKQSKNINFFRANQNNNKNDCNNCRNIYIQNININNKIIVGDLKYNNRNRNIYNFCGMNRSKSHNDNDESDTVIMNENKNCFSYNDKKLQTNHKIVNKNKNNKNINTINISDIFFNSSNLNFRNLVIKYLDNKSIMNLSSVNKKFLIIKKKYHVYIYKKLTKQKEIPFIKKVLRSVFIYCSEKLKSKNTNKESLKLFYESMNYPNMLYDDLILKDLTRTLPNDPNFERNKNNSKKLYRLLTSFSNLNKKMGYVQGLNFICANAIFLFHDEEEVFLFINGFVNKLKLDYMAVDNEKKLIMKMEEITKILKKYVPEIYQFFEQRNLSHEFFTAGWILTLFSSYMDRSHLVICWCFFIIMGWKFIYSFIIQILEKYKDIILNYSEKQLCSKMKNLLHQEQFKKDFQVIVKKTILFMESHLTL